ncbi:MULTISPECIES: hypothetical protein [Vibrio]|jgi:hypothetical protein|uniref:DUF2283 domain-containing protein n=1 Tax=Vibrio jasicida TaxID=766224 RepID=A0ABW7J527_9VIBR|nr:MULTISPECIES: hypothetical protein [Vibrio]KIP71618.1 hypothetical protein SN10_13855 [Vibrio harveyi]KIP78238.1 hypothetical protein SN11_08650 [Vibrio harveyi]NOJ18355.1 hypothetical protein [Vibrio jasicida]PAW12629.1 hypothetical protein B6K85_00170 [Vibrio sp. V1B]PQJ50391.1 hypothetical protein BTO01_25985 [Vibrio jasicida]
MKKIRYPFDLHGTLSIRYRDKVNPIFLDTDDDNQSVIDIDDFAVRSFSYDSEDRLLKISLQKALNLTEIADCGTVFTGIELEQNNIKLDIVYCLYNAGIISSSISYPLDDASPIQSIAVAKPLTLHLK